MSFAEKVQLPLHFFGLYFFSVSCNETDKNAQSRRISVSSPYKRTAETDFGERKSEYNKNQREAARLPFLNFELILLKNLIFNKPLLPKKSLTLHFFGLHFFSILLHAAKAGMFNTLYQISLTEEIHYHQRSNNHKTSRISNGNLICINACTGKRAECIKRGRHCLPEFRACQQYRIS